MVLVARGARYGGSLALAIAIASGRNAEAATPSVDAALKLTPVQTAIDFDTPKDAEISKCTIKAESIDGRTGWVVRGPGGELLRQFADTNNDNVVDQWCYYSAGLEVYRDIDSDFNGKADQYRWLNTAGSRWGVDEDEDGKVDSWKMISAEEVCAEAVEALARRDVNRFKRLMLSADELKRLAVGGDRGKALREKLDSAVENFRAAATKQKVLSPRTIWMQMGVTKPGLVPAGAEGGKEDLLVYENVISMVETDGKPAQVQIGTLIQVGQNWRLVDAPLPLDENQPEMASSSIFFFLSNRENRPGTTAGVPGGPDQKTQELLARLEKLDQAGGNGEQAANVAERCDLLEQIAERATTAEDQSQWLRSLAETLSASVQIGSYPQGLERLKSLGEKLAAQEGEEELAAYVKFRYLTAEYNQKLQDEGVDFAKVQKKWLENLEQYVSDFPNSPDAAEAMLQLGIAEEFAGEEDNAKKWYGEIVDRFGQAPAAQKASGAIARLDSVGKVLRLRGAGLNGKTIDVGQFRKKVVLVQYWATWCEPCKADMAQIRELQAKYAKDFVVVSISLDSQKADVLAYLKKNPWPWHHIYEPGGLDSRLANELGVLTLPTMLLLDQNSKVANRNVNISDLDRELKSLLR